MLSRQPLDLNLTLMRADLSKLIGRLHPQQRVCLDAEAILKADRYTVQLQTNHRNIAKMLRLMPI